MPPFENFDLLRSVLWIGPAFAWAGWLGAWAYYGAKMENPDESEVLTYARTIGVALLAGGVLGPVTSLGIGLVIGVIGLLVGAL